MTTQNNARPHRYHVRGVAAWGAVQCAQINMVVEAYDLTQASDKALAFQGDEWDNWAEWDADAPPEIDDLGEIPEDEWMRRIGQPELPLA